MNHRSAKAKGKRLEKWVASLILEAIPDLTEDDVRTTVGSETGEDIKLSKKARQFLNVSIECKNRETFGTIYKFYDQASAKEGEPVLVLKMNNKKPLVIVDAEKFFRGTLHAN